MAFSENAFRGAPVEPVPDGVEVFDAEVFPFSMRGGVDYVEREPTHRLALESAEISELLAPFALNVPIAFCTGSARKKEALARLGLLTFASDSGGDRDEESAAFYPNDTDYIFPPFNASLAAQNACAKLIPQSVRYEGLGHALAANDTTPFFLPSGRNPERIYFDSVHRKKAKREEWNKRLSLLLTHGAHPRLFVDNATCIEWQGELTWIMFLLEFEYDPGALLDLVLIHNEGNLPLGVDLATIPPEVGRLQSVRLIPAAFEYGRFGLRTDILRIRLIELKNDPELARLCHGIAPATAVVMNSLSK